ncbi:hypothetical protein STEG23_008066, partial [Scotinomys teguina]
AVERTFEELSPHSYVKERTLVLGSVRFGTPTGAAVINGSQHPSSSPSVNDVSSMSTDPTLASDTDSSLEASAGPLGCCR